MFQIILIHALIIFPSWPLELSISMHLIILPTSFVRSSIVICHCSLSGFSIIFELPIIVIAVRPLEFSSAIFLVISIKTCENSPIRPLLLPSPTALVFNPFSIVIGPISSNVFTLSVGFIIFPLSDKNIAVGVEKSTNPFCFIVYEFTVVCAFVREVKLTDPMTLTPKPLTKIVEVLGQFIWLQDE